MDNPYEKLGSHEFKHMFIVLKEYAINETLLYGITKDSIKSVKYLAHKIFPDTQLTYFHYFIVFPLLFRFHYDFNNPEVKTLEPVQLKDKHLIIDALKNFSDFFSKNIRIEDEFGNLGILRQVSCFMDFFQIADTLDNPDKIQKMTSFLIFLNKNKKNNIFPPFNFSFGLYSEFIGAGLSEQDMLSYLKWFKLFSTPFDESLKLEFSSHFDPKIIRRLGYLREIAVFQETMLRSYFKNSTWFTSQIFNLQIPDNTFKLMCFHEIYGKPAPSDKELELFHSSDWSEHPSLFFCLNQLSAQSTGDIFESTTIDSACKLNKTLKGILNERFGKHTISKIIRLHLIQAFFGGAIDIETAFELAQKVTDVAQIPRLTGHDGSKNIFELSDTTFLKFNPTKNDNLYVLKAQMPELITELDGLDAVTPFENPRRAALEELKESFKRFYGKHPTRRDVRALGRFLTPEGNEIFFRILDQVNKILEDQALNEQQRNEEIQRVITEEMRQVNPYENVFFLFRIFVIFADWVKDRLSPLNREAAEATIQALNQIELPAREIADLEAAEPKKEKLTKFPSDHEAKKAYDLGTPSAD